LASAQLEPAKGWSVAPSGDGNTAIVGGPGDNSNSGAAWVYTRSRGVWTQQGGKVFGTGAVGNAVQGSSVALSGDGNTAIVGGYGDNSNAGAAWLYTRSGGVWTQQGSKLVGTGAVGAAYQGASVTLSGNSSTAIVGGPGDNSNAGAAWVYARSGGVWTQQGGKLIGSAVGAAEQSYSVALSTDGNIAIVGGNADNSNTGAAWVFVQPTLPSSQVAVVPPPPPPPPAGPTVTIKSPANGATYRGYFSADIAVSAADPTGIASITIKVDSTILKTCTKTTSCSDIWRYRSPPGTRTITATAIDKAGISGSASIVITDVTPVTTATVTLTATPASITAGQSSTLTWSSTNATSCSASGGWSGAQAVGGSLMVSPAANSTYTLTCAGNGGSASASASITVTPPPVASNCGNVLGGTVTFCETFDDPNPGIIPSRTGGLDPNVWGVSRTTGFFNLGQGQYNTWAPTALIGCSGTTTVTPPNDVLVCNGQLREASNDNPTGVFDGGSVTSLAMYPKQPFDFAGRTGTVSFDVSNDSHGNHSAWPEFWMSDLPVPDPFSHFNSWTALPANGFAVRFAAQAEAGQFGLCPNSNNLSSNRWTVDSGVVVRGYIYEDVDYQGVDYGTASNPPLTLNILDCVIAPANGSGVMNHIEIQVTQSA
jgi:hypothetical protein